MEWAACSRKLYQFQHGGCGKDYVMHIEPGVVTGAKIISSYVTAAASFGIAARMAWNTISRDGGFAAFCWRAVITTALVFSFFEVLPHYPVGVSEVHLILGSTLFLVFGAGPAATGLACGLLVQGLFFAPFDLPQYGMNVTTLLAPLYVMDCVARRIIPQKCAYKDVQYRQALALSTTYQAGIVVWVGFWAFYGEGLSAATLGNIATFGLAYMSVIIIEPLIDLAILGIAKNWSALSGSSLVQQRLYHKAT